MYGMTGMQNADGVNSQITEVSARVEQNIVQVKICSFTGNLLPWHFFPGS